ncbi:MAG: hypothetical protein KDH92_14285 [Chloroflexi bacterium]|nr:hypothetical protein [Chloroflexota bacterium]
MTRKRSPRRISGRRLPALVCLLLGLLAAPVAARPAPEPPDAMPSGPLATSALPPAPGGYRLTRSYQSSPEVPLGVLEDPAGISVAADGSVFVSDRELHRAQRFLADGTPLQAYGRPGDGDGELFAPSGLAVDLARDRLYVGDTENDRVAIFHLDGRFETNWGPFEAPEGLAVGRGGRVYIFEGDTGAIRIREPDGSGDLLVQPGAFIKREPGIAGGMAIGPDGNLYVAMNLGVRKYSPDGDLLGNGAPRMYASGAPITRGVSFDARGRIYVLEENRLRYEWTGGLALPVAVSLTVRAIAAGEPGTLYLIVPKSKDLPAGVVVRRFDNGHQTAVRRWGIPQTVLGWLNQPLRLGIGPGDELYVVDDLRRVQRFGPELTGAMGQLVIPGLLEVAPIDRRSMVISRTRFGSSGDDPDDADLAPPGKQAARVERYDLDGPLTGDAPDFASLSRTWQHEIIDDITAGDASRVLGVASHPPSGQTWVIDAGKARLTGYQPDGRKALELSLPSVEAGFPAWSDLALARDGSVFALHTAERRLYHFGADGSPRGHIELPEWVWRVAIDPQGGFILPTARRWVWRLDAEGRPTALWPLPDPAYGDPQPPSDVAVGSDGTVYLLDQGSSAIYAFEPEPGLPADGLPVAGRLRCQVSATTELEPQEVELGQPVSVGLRIGGTCQPHNRTGERPARLLRGGSLTVTLPSGVRLVPGSDHPPARVSGRELAWELGEIGPAGEGIDFAVLADQPGRYTLPESASMRYLDGWFDFGQGGVEPGLFFTLIPATATPPPLPTAAPMPALHLPWLSRGP